MAFLITVVISGPAHVLIFLIHELVAATIILSCDLGCIDLNGRGGALRPKAAGATIAPNPIVPTFLMVLARSFRGLSSLRMMKKHGSYLLGAEQKGALVLSMILGRF